ncbi:D-alanyl-D-alanine carboxypeptidase family protein [Methyloceanibacter caenitepidi]|uniref:serine-type D-Ala-D-Ala carboxypeptidase n=1 Tax=Methyloceanibacter caenitepidi TaxID=1384459 RepID=A0A0A8K3V1_9HYPH|nr:D-alanyl-D-alanine carboxypeptidase family protein [Methyloceanibacter caenitepidi]BAQ17628.1 D-alanyl-D-alanine carboxypeptidase [Methyloceanibacter caenitepidi]
MTKVAVACACCALGLALAAGVASAAANKTNEFTTKAQSGILLDSGADLVLYEKDADKQIPPASMSKLMTLAVVFRELKAGRITLDDTFTVSEHAWRTGGAPSGTAAMFAPLGSPITVSDLIQGVTVQSANDGALILAEGIGGTEGGFVKMMNDYAKQIGLTGSNFVNPTGLPAEGHLMTARDLALLSKHIIDTYPEYYHYFAQKEFRYRDKFTFRNRNPLVWADIGVDGLKTGYTEEAGYGLVSSAKRGDQRLVLVLTGLENKGDRESESRRVLEWGFKSFRPFRLFEDGQQVSEALVWGGEKHYVPLVGDGAIDLLLPASATGAVTGEIIYEGPIKAPIKKGDQIATLKVQSADLAAINEIPLYAGEDINSSGFAMRGIDSLLVLAFGWLL